MRAKEFINPDLEEGFKEKAIGAGVLAGGLAGLLGPNMLKNLPQADQVVNTPQPAITQQYNQPTPQVVAPQTQPSPVTQPNVNKPITKPTQVPIAPPARKLTGVEDMLKKTAQQAGMKGHEVAQFLAQTAHETGNFMAMEEQGDKKYLMHRYWNNVPMRKALGNKHPSDAVRYKGRGFIQLTGRGNYARMGKLLNVDLLNHPELAKRPDVAAKIAVAYFQDRVEPNVQDFSDTKAVTKKINPHDKAASTKDRDDKFKQYNNLLGNR
jgi:putative chitinase